MESNPLGQETNYNNNYNPELLFPIERPKGRNDLKARNFLFSGYDIWTAYEFSWLNKNGRPEVRKISFVYDCFSENIVESKSLKLYLGSFSMTRFNSEKDVIAIIKKDLKKCLNPKDLEIRFFGYNDEVSYTNINSTNCIDDIDEEIIEYNYNPGLLEFNNNPGEKCSDVVVSNLFKSNCPVTGQPDWATVFFEYKAEGLLERSSVLKYLVSFREHSEYHETCCERIFNDIYNLINPEVLIIKCFFTRRGGIEINPCRFYGVNPDNDLSLHFWRQ